MSVSPPPGSREDIAQFSGEPLTREEWNRFNESQLQETSKTKDIVSNVDSRTNLRLAQTPEGRKILRGTWHYGDVLRKIREYVDLASSIDESESNK